MKKRNKTQGKWIKTMQRTKKQATRVLLLSLLIAASIPAIAAQSQLSRLTQHWTAHDENSTATVDNSAFADLLNKYVVVRDDAPNLFRYKKVTPDDHKRLQTYIHKLSNVALAKYNRNVQLAYWLNLYNAALLNLVLDHYPVDSIRDINWGQAKAWEIPVVRVDGIRLSLANILHAILRPIWQRPLIYYGLGSAALGGPELRPEPYTGDDIYLQLRADAKHFVNSPQDLRIKDNQLIVSKFFDRYRNAFGRSDTALISQLREHAAPALSARLDVFNTISAFTFDWHLNDAAARKK